MEDNVKIGSKVKLLRTSGHNSDAPAYDHNVTVSSAEVGNIVEILDIGTDRVGHNYYKIQCNLGITYLRRNAFELVPEFKLPEYWHVVATEESVEVLLRWRKDLEREFTEADKKYYIDKIIGICKNPDGSVEKAHNPSGRIKAATYDFGEEITFDQFREYVLGEKLEPEDHRHLERLLKEIVS